MRIALQDRGDPRASFAVHDRAGAMPGRGAYLCYSPERQQPAAECLRLAARRGAIARALRCAASAEAKLVESIST